MRTGNLASQKGLLVLADGAFKRKLGKLQRFQPKVLVLAEFLRELPPHFPPLQPASGAIHLVGQEKNLCELNIFKYDYTQGTNFENICSYAIYVSSRGHL